MSKVPGLVPLMVGVSVANGCDECDAGGPNCVDNCVESCDCFDSGGCVDSCDRVPD